MAGNNADNLTAMIATTDGGYLLGGASNSEISGDRSGKLRNICSDFSCDTDYWVVKVDKNGLKVWDKTYGGYSQDALEVIVATSDGGYLLGGYSSSGISSEKSQDSKGDTDYWIVKINSTGDKLWDKTLGGSCHENLQAILPTSDGGYLLGGTSESGASGDKSEKNRSGINGGCSNVYSDYWIVKVNANGQKIWDKSFGGPGQDIFSVMIATPDGGFLLGGTSDSEKGMDKSQNSRGNNDYWLVKVNTKGQKTWDKTIGGSGYEELTALTALKDGSYLLGGTSGSDVSGEKSEVCKDVSGHEYYKSDYWVVKLDGSGGKLWDQTLGGEAQDRLQALIAMADGGYLLGGFSTSGRDGDKSEENRGGEDYWIMKTNARGEKKWDKSIGGTSSDRLQVMLLTLDGNCLLGGYSLSDIGGDKQQDNKSSIFFYGDYWAVKMEVPTKKIQTIAFKSIPDKIIKDAPFTLSATVSSGLSVSFSVVSGPATIKGNTVTLTGVGAVAVKAWQGGNASYSASEVIQFFNVSFVPKQWDKTLGGNGEDYLRALVATPDGGYLLGGGSNSGKSGDKSAPNKSLEDYVANIWIVKTNSQGARSWDQTFGGDYGAGISDIVVTPDGGYLLGGSSRSDISGDKTENSRGSSDYWIIKTDNKGKKLWDKTFGGSNAEALAEIIVTPDGGYLLGGTSQSGMGGDKTEARKGSKAFWVVKIDANGNKIWDKTYGGRVNDELYGLVNTADGGYLLGGTSSSGKNGDKSQASKGGTDYWVIKIDAQGKKQWDKTLGGLADENLHDIVAASDGGYLLGGDSNSEKGADKSQVSKGGFDYWVVKLDAGGNKQWDKTIGGDETDVLRSMVSTSDGNYLLGGNSGSPLGGDKSESSIDGWDYWVVKINADGNKVWDETFGTSGQDLFSSLAVGTDGSYLLGGYTAAGKDGDKSEVSRGQYDYWVVRLKEDLSLTAQWNMRYGGTGSEGFTTIIKTSDGGYLSGGYSASGVSGDKTQASQGKNDYWIVKSDQNGKKLWDKRYGGTDEDYLNTLISTSDGGYLLGGSSLSGKGGDKSKEGWGNRDYWIVKIDKAGTKQWDKRYGGSGTEELQKVIQLATGEYFLAGYSNSPVSGDKTQASQGGNDYWLVKISSTGTKIWDKRYGGALDENLEAVVLTSDGGFLLGGSSLSDKSGDKTQANWGSKDYWVVRVDSKGIKLWEKRYGGKGEDNLMDMARMSAGDFLLAGHSTSGAEGDRSQNSRGGKDFWLLKVNGRGEKLWDKRFGGSEHEGLRTVLLTSDGGYLLAGRSESGKSGDKTQDSRGSSDYWIVKTSSTGVKQWDKRFGGSGYDEIRMASQTADGGYLLGGRSDSGVSGDRTQPSQGGSDYWLVKVAPEATSIVAEREATLIAKLRAEAELSPLSVYPNPAKEQVTVSFTLSQTQTAQVKVYDNQGKEVITLFQGKVHANQTYQLQWLAGNKATGMYLLRLHTSGKSYTSKILLSR